MREISILKKRILEYLDSHSITKYECYQKTGITNGVLSQNNGMSEDNLLRFLTYYKDINIEWLILGHGPMNKAAQQISVADDRLVNNENTDNEYLIKYIKKLEYENEKKQELIDGFLSGAIVVDKKEPPDASVSYQSTG